MSSQVVCTAKLARPVPTMPVDAASGMAQCPPDRMATPIIPQAPQGAGRLPLAVFGILAYHGLFVLILERDLQRCCPEIGRKHEGDGFPACAREFCPLGDGALHGPLLGLMLITA